MLVEKLSANLAGLGWLIVFLVSLLVLQRLVHREIQLILLIVTRRPDLSVTIFSLIFLPGVFLHEISHFIAARLVGVRTGRISILPHPLPGGKVRLGYVETAPVGWLRGTLIGIAPLICGLAFVAYGGLIQLQLAERWEMAAGFRLPEFWEALNQLRTRPDFWLWFYLVLTVSSMMFPSASDRQSWLPVGITTGILILISVLFGAGPWMEEHLAPLLNRFFQSVAAVFAISLLAHAVLYIPSWITRWLLCRLIGKNVQSNQVL